MVASTAAPPVAGRRAHFLFGKEALEATVDSILDKPDEAMGPEPGASPPSPRPPPPAAPGAAPRAPIRAASSLELSALKAQVPAEAADAAAPRPRRITEASLARTSAPLERGSPSPFRRQQDTPPPSSIAGVVLGALSRDPSPPPGASGMVRGTLRRVSAPLAEAYGAGVDGSGSGQDEQGTPPRRATTGVLPQVRARACVTCLAWESRGGLGGAGSHGRPACSTWRDMHDVQLTGSCCPAA